MMFVLNGVKINFLFAGQDSLTLSEENVANGGIDVVTDWLTAVDHQTVDKLHRLGTLSTQLA